jgi:sulfite reductase beta subunit-like hemoprotein
MDDLATVRRGLGGWTDGTIERRAADQALDRIEAQLRSLTEENERLNRQHLEDTRTLVRAGVEQSALERQLSTQAEELERLTRFTRSYLDWYERGDGSEVLEYAAHRLALEAQAALQPPTQQGEMK